MLDWLAAADRAGVSWAAERLVGGWLESLAVLADRLGSKAAIWLALGLAVALLRPHRLAGLWQLLLAVLLTFAVVNGILKPVVGRARPVVSQAAAELPPSPSFPSGHAASAFAGAHALSRMWRPARPVLWILAGWIAVSRVVLGVHYPTDVAAGALVGLACAAFVIGGTTWPDAPTVERG